MPPVIAINTIQAKGLLIEEEKKYFRNATD